MPVWWLRKKSVPLSASGWGCGSQSVPSGISPFTVLRHATWWTGLVTLLEPALWSHYLLQFQFLDTETSPKPSGQLGKARKSGGTEKGEEEKQWSELSPLLVSLRLNCIRWLITVPVASYGSLTLHIRTWLLCSWFKPQNGFCGFQREYHWC